MVVDVDEARSYRETRYIHAQLCRTGLKITDRDNSIAFNTNIRNNWSLVDASENTTADKNDVKRFL